MDAQTYVMYSYIPVQYEYILYLVLMKKTQINILFKYDMEIEHIAKSLIG